MRADILRTSKTVHTWTGILSGLALFIAFYAGALTMFKGPLEQWVTPPAPAASGDVQGAEALLRQLVQARPEARADLTLALGDGRQRPHRITWQARGDPVRWSATLDAAGALQMAPQQQTELAEFIDVVHRTAGLPIDLEGSGVMAVVGAVYALAIVSGIVVLLPTLAKDFLALRLGPNLKRMWLDAHNLVGIVSLPFHLVMALSAMVFGLHDLIYDAQKVAVYGDARFEQIWRASGPFAAAPPDHAPAALLPVPVLLEHSRALAPGFEPHTLRLRGAGTAGGAAWVTGQQPCCMQRSARGGHMLISTVDARLLHAEYLAGAQSGWMAAVSSFFSLHFGNYGGGTVRWGYFFLGLAGAFLFYSGNLLWIESRRKLRPRGDETPPLQSRATRLMAAGTVGVALGCICGLSLTIVAGKWLHGHVADLNAWHRHAYHAAFLGSVGWAFIRGAPRAGVELPALAAVLTWAIPLTTLAGTLWPELGWWAHAAPGALGIDIVAAVGGAAFAAMAFAAARRVRAGAPDRVWSGGARKPAEDVVDPLNSGHTTR